MGRLRHGGAKVRPLRGALPQGDAEALAKFLPGLSRPLLGEAERSPNFRRAPFVRSTKSWSGERVRMEFLWLQGLRGVGPTPLQATFRNTSPYRGVPICGLLLCRPRVDTVSTTGRHWEGPRPSTRSTKARAWSSSPARPCSPIGRRVPHCRWTQEGTGIGDEWTGADLQSETCSSAVATRTWPRVPGPGPGTTF